MAKINRQRMTALSDEPYVVFLIGMRINNLFAIHKWLPVFIAMPKMLKELHIHRELGFKVISNVVCPHHNFTSILGKH